MEISTVIVQSNALSYGTMEGGMRMLDLASRETKEEMMEGISTPTPSLPGSRIYSLSSPAWNIWSSFWGWSRQNFIVGPLKFKFCYKISFIWDTLIVNWLRTEEGKNLPSTQRIKGGLMDPIRHGFCICYLVSFTDKELTFKFLIGCKTLADASFIYYHMQLSNISVRNIREKSHDMTDKTPLFLQSLDTRTW